MSYCSNCGARVNDQGVCPNCGGVTEDHIPTAKKKVPEFSVCVKSLFSSHPLTGIENAARTNSSSVWIPFGMFYALSAVIFGAKLFLTPRLAPFIELMLGEKLAAASVTACGEISADMLKSISLLTVYIVLMVAFMFLVFALSAKIIYALADATPTFSQSLNVASVSLFPLSCCLILGTIFSAFSITLAVLSLLIGAMLFAICIYFGTQKAAAFSKSPFWLFAAELMSCCVLTCLFSAILTKLLF